MLLNILHFQRTLITGSYFSYTNYLLFDFYIFSDYINTRLLLFIISWDTKLFISPLGRVRIVVPEWKDVSWLCEDT